MDVPTEILDILKCGVCGAQLSRGPVYLQHSDETVRCSSCHNPKTKATRNVQYEALAKLHIFPCKYKDLGCEDKVPFVQGNEVIPHEETCEHRHRRERKAQEQEEVTKTGTKKRSEQKTQAKKAKQRQKRETREVCAGCGAQVTALVYRDKRGWVCERCAPARRACMYQAEGCNHRDIDSKCGKHQQFFCEQQTFSFCLVCDKKVERGSWSEHYSSACVAVCKVGATWRATRGRGQWCFVSGAAGIALCGYDLDDAGFELDVYSSVTSERLREFGCVVRVTQPNTGHVRTYTPYREYDETYDWSIYVNNTHFPTWDGVLDVLVDITKILA